jgi:hypothetical protein
MEAMLPDEPYCPDDREPDAHRAQMHPDLTVAKQRRGELEQLRAARWRKERMNDQPRPVPPSVSADVDRQTERTDLDDRQRKWTRYQLVSKIGV